MQRRTERCSLAKAGGKIDCQRAIARWSQALNRSLSRAQRLCFQQFAERRNETGTFAIEYSYIKTMNNQLKTVLLLGLMSGLLLGIGALVGRGYMPVFLIFAVL